MHVYSLAGTSLHDKITLAHNGAVTSLKYSPDGTLLAAADTYRKVLLYQLPDYSVCTLAFCCASLHLLKLAISLQPGSVSLKC